MAYLFDADALSELARSRPLSTYTAWLAEVPPSAQFTCATVIGEIVAGAHRRQAPPRAQSFADRLVAEIQILQIDSETAQTYGRIRARLADAGTPIAENDLWIAACAIQNDLELVTGNLRHFERLEPHGLRLCRVLAEARGGG